MGDKKIVGTYAASLVKDGDVVGLGTGSTTAFAIAELSNRIKNEINLNLWCTYLISGKALGNRIKYTPYYS